MILDVIIFNDSNNDNSHNDLIKPILFCGNLHVLLVGNKFFWRDNYFTVDYKMSKKLVKVTIL